MAQNQIVFLALGGPGLLIILVGFLIPAFAKARNNKCSCKAVGKVVSYYYRGEMRVGPVIEFSTESGVYKAKKRFAGYTQKVKYPFGKSSLWEDEKGFLHSTRGMVGRWKEHAEQLWPIGSEMEVYYDPNKPTRNYVERPLSHKPERTISILTGLFFIALSIVMLFII